MLAINLYCKIPFGRLHKENPDIIRLAGLLGRTPSALSWKLVNFASLDPSLEARGIKGAKNTSKLDKIVWEEFYNNWNSLAFESEMILYKRNQQDVSGKEYSLKEGKEKERIIKTRVNQSFFRSTLLASYNNRCCITGISNTEFLIASHIVPWSVDDKNRLNPRNGILVNALHDKAFEYGYITITTDYKVLVCKELLLSKESANDKYFKDIHNQDLILPSRFLPDSEFLKYHNQERFKQ
ncbi:HNH endonuclease [Candidatus Haliotispira prima]|uniref:HNH endonuclease n=1 Tax=Candidatus Haliotispira prima TaxID=3034016 RepID=A0ABY8MGF6_9SPIO|nr:HNH endonuclease [Candidatus Haliotispira prima]